MSFETLTDELIETAIGRAEGRLTPADVLAAAERAGAPIAPNPVSAAARTVLSELSWRQHTVPPGLARVLADALGAQDPPTDAERAAAEWADATLERRGKTIKDLVNFGDSLPRRRRGPESAFPGFVTASE